MLKQRFFQFFQRTNKNKMSQPVERTASLELDEIFNNSRQHLRSHNRRQSIDPTRFFASQNLQMQQPIRPKTTEPQIQQPIQEEETTEKKQSKEESNTNKDNGQQESKQTDSLENEQNEEENSKESRKFGTEIDQFNGNRSRSHSLMRHPLEEDEELNEIQRFRNDESSTNIQNEYLSNQRELLDSDDEEESDLEDQERNANELSLSSSSNNVNQQQDDSSPLPLDQSQIRNAVRQIYDYYSQHMSPRASPSIQQQPMNAAATTFVNNEDNSNSTQEQPPMDSNVSQQQQPQQLIPTPSTPQSSPAPNNDNLSIILQIRNQLILFQLDHNGAIVRHQLLDPALANALLEQHSQQSDGQVSRLDLVLDQMFNQAAPKPPPKAMSKVVDFLCQQPQQQSQTEQQQSDGISQLTCSTSSKCEHQQQSISPSNNNSPSCPICMESTNVNNISVADGDKTPTVASSYAVSMPCCHQILHQECLRSWLSNTCSCPLCRYQFPTDDKDFELERIERMKQRSSGLLPLEQTFYRPNTPA